MLRTDNLTILFVDIAEFTATTSRQSRVENAALLQTFGSTLLPMVKGFKGHVVKHLGDAMLLTFRSPTDAMLCAMALQDAMHAHNLAVPEHLRIHIRVAAHLGEVRITKGDIFGEPVNVTSRIEGITPTDEIYLSEAVYMAMNKAEVPAQEAGLRELKGIPHPVRIYNIPRFATPRLVPENSEGDESGSAIRFPYGGMHHNVRSTTLGGFLHDARLANARSGFALAVAALVLGSALIIAYGFWPSAAPEETAATGEPAAPPEVPAQDTTPAAVVTQPSTDAAATQAPAETADSAAAAVLAQPPAEESSPAAEPAKTVPAAAPAKAAARPATTTASKPKPVASPAPAAFAEPAASAAPEPVVWNVRRAKLAYRASTITKAEYREIVQELEKTYRDRIYQLKADYRASKITKAEYGAEVRKAKIAYAGD